MNPTTTQALQKTALPIRKEQDQWAQVEGRRSQRRASDPTANITPTTNRFEALKTMELDTFCDEDFVLIGISNDANEATAVYKHRKDNETRTNTINTNIQLKQDLKHRKKTVLRIAQARG